MPLLTMLAFAPIIENIRTFYLACPLALNVLEEIDWLSDGPAKVRDHAPGH